MAAVARPLAWRARLAQAAYTLALRALTPLYLARLWWRGRAEPGYRLALAERLALSGPATEVPRDLWVHAVSLGETRAAQALVQALRELRPATRLLLTHGTATGREAGAELLRPGDAQAWLPYDTPGAVARFLRRRQPRLGVLMETEIWPNLLRGAQAAGVPMVLANARLSEKSLRQAHRYGALLQPAAERLTLALAQSDADALRLRAAGVPRVERSGNLKYDLAPDEALLERGAQWRVQGGRPVVLAAITREGEEAMLLAAWTGVPAPKPLLVVVPRHPQRFDEVAALIEAAGFTLARRSAWASAPPPDAAQCDVWLGDSMREMPLYFAAAHVALLGGSFAPLGGHNLIEAAACGCPVVLGPHTFNFAEAAELSVAAGAAFRVPDMAAGVQQALELLDPARQAEAASRARAFAAQHRGAARRMAERIVALLDGG